MTIEFRFDGERWHANENGVGTVVTNPTVIAHLKLARATLLTERYL